MTTILALVAILAAAVWLGRRVRVSLKRKAMRKLPGGSMEQSLEVSSFGEIDQAISARHCWCGGRLVLEGEGSRERGGNRYRIARLTCVKCDQETALYFDVTRVYH